MKKLLHNLNTICEQLESHNYHKEAIAVTNIMQRIAFGDPMMGGKKSSFKEKSVVDEAKMPESLDIDSPCENEGCISCSDSPIVKETHIFLTPSS